MGQPSVVVVGSGIGGSAIAALLAHSGRFQVDLFERNQHVGGRFASFTKDGFRLDVGCHVIANCERGCLGQVLERLGEPDAVKWHHLSAGAHVFRYRDREFEFPAGVGKMGLSADQVEQVTRFYHRLVTLTEPQCETLDQVSVLREVERHLQDDRVRTLFGMLNSIYFVTRDDETPAGEFARCSRHIAQNRAMGYPLGGTEAIPAAYLRIFQASGGRLHLGRAVERIIVQDGAARGVRLADGTEHRADMVISNVDVKTTLGQLLGPANHPGVGAVEGYEYSQCVGAMKVALDQRFLDKELITYLGGDDLAGWDQAVSCSLVPESVEFMMVSVVSNMDPSACPPGRQLLVAASAAPPATQPLSDEQRRKWEAAYLRGLEVAFPGMGAHVMWAHYTSPVEIDRLCGEEGCVIGLGQKMGQTGRFRPPVVDPHVANLYHCSADTGAHGIGGELAAEAALRLHDLLVSGDLAAGR
jgi:phytoene dehydrogenase-like protein